MTRTTPRRLLVGCVAIGVIIYSGFLLVRHFREEELGTRRPGLPAQGPPRSVMPRDASHDFEQDAQLMAALSVKERWVQLPSFVDSVVKDDSDRVWFTLSGSFSPADLTRSVERAAKGETRIIRGGEIVYVDSRGRYWAMARLSAKELLCFDGKRWLEPRKAPAAPPSTAPVPAPSKPVKTSAVPREQLTGTFSHHAFEDSAGNVYFISSGIAGAPSGLHRFGVDGQWSFFPFPRVRAHMSDPQFCEQAGGRLAILPAEPTRQSIHRDKDWNWKARETAPALIFDGSSFVTYQANDRPDENLQVHSMTAFPDGSIGTLYIKAKWDSFEPFLAIAWPAGPTLEAQQVVKGLLPALDSTSAEKRADAIARIVRLGPPIRDHIDALLQSPDELLPQQKNSLEQIRRQLAELSQADEKVDGAVFGGRYKLKSIYHIYRPHDGVQRLLVSGCEDVITRTDYGPSFVYISRDGSWKVKSLVDSSYNAFTSYGWGQDDPKGVLWYDTTKMLMPDQTVRSMAGFGFRPTQLLEVDRDGRAYFSSIEGRYVCNPDVPLKDPDLPIEVLDYRRFTYLPGERHAWFTSMDLLKVSSDGSMQKLELPKGRRPGLVFPLRDGAVMPWLSQISGESDERGPWLWDGKEWEQSSSKEMQVVAHEFGKKLMKLAPRGAMPPLYNDSHLVYLISDRGQGLWFHAATVEFFGDNPTNMDSRIIKQLEYFDGEQWHDVWKLFPLDSPAEAPDPEDPPRLEKRTPGLVHNVLGTVDDGRTLLVGVAKKGLHAVRFENGALKAEPITTDVRVGSRQLESPSQRVWFWTATVKMKTRTIPGSLAEYKDGKFIAHEYMGKPLLADSRDRLWCVEGETFAVKTDTGVASIDVRGADESATVVESADGRIWLLHRRGMSHIAVNDAGGKPVLKETHCWKWNSPKNSFYVWADDTSVWLSGDDRQVGRIMFPKPE